MLDWNSHKRKLSSRKYLLDKRVPVLAVALLMALVVEFDPDKSWDEKKEVYRLSNKIVRTMNITQSAVGDKNGKWTTVIAAAIFIFS